MQSFSWKSMRHRSIEAIPQEQLYVYPLHNSQMNLSLWFEGKVKCLAISVNNGHRIALDHFLKLTVG
jgi:hypothetical protein